MASTGTGDPFENAARIIEEFGVCYARARRYRAIAELCEERYLARVLTLGSDLRRELRVADAAGARGSSVEDAATAVAELRALVASCADAIATVHASDSYRAATRAWADQRWDDVASLAAGLFDGVEPCTAPPMLYHAIDVTPRRRGGEHFLPAAAVAERIAALARAGVAAADPVPDLGCDDAIRAVFLEDDPDAAPSPIALEVDAATIGLPTFRLGGAGEVLVYAPSVRATTRVRCAADVTDEWWAVRPHAYTAYVDALEGELAARGMGPVVRG
jgi:hypothetical protein